MERLARFVVRHRRLVLFVAVLLLIPSLLGAIGTYINYDILTYLPAELDSMIGETYLEDDFHMASTAMLTVENLPTAETLKMKEELAQVPGVRKVVWTSDMLDVTIPSEMLPADVRDFFYNNSGATMLLVQFEGTSASAETMAAIQQIKTILRKDCFIGGMSAILADTKALIDQEIPLYVLCAVGCSLVVLFLSLKSTVVPFIFMLGLAFPIAYNFGTNIFLGQISYITEALATVLQLGVTMDFSIFLLHRFEEEKADLGGTNLTDAQLEECMTRAICNTASSISASSLTTIAGFLAMCTMSLTLGADIGIVMAKGVALGVVCTVTVLPALLMQFRKPIEKFNHRTLVPKLPRTAKFVTKHYLPLLICFLILVIPFGIAQNKVDIYYTLFDSLPQTMDGIVGTNRLKDDFNMTTSHFVIVDENLTNRQLTELSNEMAAVDGVNQVLSYEKFLGGAIPETLVPADLRDIFHAGGHRMILVNSSYKSGADEQNHQLEELDAIVKSYDPQGVISGEGAMTKDLIQVAQCERHLHRGGVRHHPHQLRFRVHSGAAGGRDRERHRHQHGHSVLYRNPAALCGQHRGGHHSAGRHGGLRHSDHHSLQRGAGEGGWRERGRPHCGGTVQPEHSDQRPDLLCGHRQRGSHLPNGADQQPVPPDQPRRADQHGRDYPDPSGAAYCVCAGHRPHHPPLAQARQGGSCPGAAWSVCLPQNEKRGLNG